MYIIPKTEEVYEQSVAISESECGKHYGSRAIALGLIEALGFIRMEGCIREDNSASLNAHRKCGITITDDYEYMWIPSENKNIKMLKMYYDII